MATRKEPPRIPDTPENIALACMQGPPKKDWRYLENKEQSSKPQRPEGSRKK